MNRVSAKAKSARDYAKQKWSAFAWLHLVPEEIRDRYKRTLIKCDDYDREVQRLRLICDELDKENEKYIVRAEQWQKAYYFMKEAYELLLKEGAAM